MKTLHEAIANSEVAKSVGLIISPYFLAGHGLEQLARSLGRLVGADLETETNGLRFQITNIVLDPNMFARPSIRETDGRFQMESGGGIEIFGKFTFEANEGPVSYELSDVKIDVGTLRFNLQISSSHIKIEGAELSASASINLNSDRSGYHVPERTMRRLEALEIWLERYGPSNFVRQFINFENEMLINDMLRAFKISEPAHISLIDDHVFISAQDVTVISSSDSCPSPHSDDISVEINTEQRNGAPDRVDSKITIKKHPKKGDEVYEPRDAKNGLDVAVYLPKKVVDQSFGKVFPSVSTRVKGRNLFRYDGWLHARLEHFSSQIDPQKLGIASFVKIGMDGNVKFSAKVECVGTVDIGDANTETIDPLEIDMLTQFVFRDGKLRGETSVLEARNAKFLTKVQLFQRWLGLFGGWGAAYGWVIDLMASDNVSGKASRESKDRAVEYINKNSFTILDISKSMHLIQGRFGLRGVFSENNGSLVLGVGAVDR